MAHPQTKLRAEATQFALSPLKKLAGALLLTARPSAVSRGCLRTLADQSRIRFCRHAWVALCFRLRRLRHHPAWHPRNQQGRIPHRSQR